MDGDPEEHGGGHWDVAVPQGWRLAGAATASALLPCTQEGDVQTQPRSEAPGSPGSSGDPAATASVLILALVL